VGIQSFGDSFSFDKLIRARNLAREMTYELSSQILAGMVEEDAHALYRDLSKKYAVGKQWHAPKMRFGPNTTLNFSELSVPYILQEEDIFFIDIGPVIEGHEADYGETFTIGSHYEHKLITEASRKVFNAVTDYWKTTKSSGGPLYQFAQEKAQSLGFTFNAGQDGHRIGDFPHHVFFKGGLAECQEQVISDAWILEIHLWSPGKKVGAFFEDLLSDQII
jgi:methionine aminopeptidase